MFICLADLHILLRMFEGFTAFATQEIERDPIQVCKCAFSASLALKATSN